MTIVVSLYKTLYWSYVSTAMFVCRLALRSVKNQIKTFITTKFELQRQEKKNTTKYHQMRAIKGIAVHSLGCIIELRKTRIYQSLFHATALRVLSSCLYNVLNKYDI
jgi:hypothetical protein